MTPLQYEKCVAEHFTKLGYATTLTPQSNDFGVDVFAARGAEKIAIQAKMYGESNRQVNREMVMKLHGSKDYFGCTKATLVTDGDISKDAFEVASKLHIEILQMSFPESMTQSPSATGQASSPTFDEIWKTYVMPLAGRTVTSPDDLKNTITKVDWGGIERLSSKGKPSSIDIEIFKWAVSQILKRGFVTRDEINHEYPKRGSSCVALVLSQVPLFEWSSNPIMLRLKNCQHESLP